MLHPNNAEENIPYFERLTFKIFQCFLDLKIPRPGGGGALKMYILHSAS